MGISIDAIKSIIPLLEAANRLDLVEQLNNLRIELVDVKEANLNLRKDNSDLNQQLELKSKVVFERGICWIESDEMTNADSKTPICPQCYQVNNIVNRLPIVTNINGSWISCMNCSTSHNIK